MKIEYAVKLCISSRRRFSTTAEAIEAVRMIAALKPTQWATVGEKSGYGEHVLPGLVTQCGCSGETIDWMNYQVWEINAANLNRVLNKFSKEGNDKGMAYQEEWRLYWGAWFLESRIPLEPIKARRAAK